MGCVSEKEKKAAGTGEPVREKGEVKNSVAKTAAAPAPFKKLTPQE
jgi:hypothetical protein